MRKLVSKTGRILRNGACGTLGVAHTSTKYVLNELENAEATIREKYDGVERMDTIERRRKITTDRLVKHYDRVEKFEQLMAQTRDKVATKTKEATDAIGDHLPTVTVTKPKAWSGKSGDVELSDSRALVATA